MMRKHILSVGKRKALVLLLCLALFIVIFFTTQASASDFAETKPSPFSFCGDFKENQTLIQIDNRYYQLIDTVEFELSKDNPSQSYESRGEDLVFSFVEASAPMNFSLHVKGDAKIHRGGFTGISSVKISLESKSAYRFEYKLGFKDPDDRNSDLVNSVNGKMNVYRVV